MFGPEDYQDLDVDKLEESASKLSLEEENTEDKGTDPYEDSRGMEGADDDSEDLKNEKDANSALAEGAEDEVA